MALIIFNGIQCTLYRPIMSHQCVGERGWVYRLNAVELEIFLLWYLYFVTSFKFKIKSSIKNNQLIRCKKSCYWWDFNSWSLLWQLSAWWHIYESVVVIFLPGLGKCTGCVRICVGMNLYLFVSPPEGSSESHVSAIKGDSWRKVLVGLNMVGFSRGRFLRNCH